MILFEFYLVQKSRKRLYAVRQRILSTRRISIISKQDILYSERVELLHDINSTLGWQHPFSKTGLSASEE